MPAPLGVQKTSSAKFSTLVIALTICRNIWCRQAFTVNARERELLEIFGIEQDPRECPQCRHWRRAMFKGRVAFHRRKSSKSGVEFISCYPAEAPFPVYTLQEWWADDWDPTQFGASIDLEDAFFPQFKKLYLNVPKAGSLNNKTENCEYSVYATDSKNAYYSDVVAHSQDIYYCENITGHCEMLCDCLRCSECGGLYECVECQACRDSSFLLSCSTSWECHYCFDCIGCHHCLFSYNRRNASYLFENRQLTPVEYEDVRARVVDGSAPTQEECRGKWKALLKKASWPALRMVLCEACTGNALAHCCGCRDCYNCVNSEDCHHSVELGASELTRSNLDVTMGGTSELVYNTILHGASNYFVRMCLRCRGSTNLTYCIDCFSCQDCFGCTGLRRKRYCILNREYSPQEYYSTQSALIEQMKEAGEWGEFFPADISLYGYNLSMAMNYFPLSREEALARGSQWDDGPQTQNVSDGEASSEAPAGEDEALCCERSARRFRITSKELAFYRRRQLPLPRLHPDLRMNERRALLLPWRVWRRECSSCGLEIDAAFDREDKRRVLCSTCYDRLFS